MKFLRAFCRLLFGLVFVFSGFAKLIDPIGTGLIVKEYLISLHMAFLEPLSVAAGLGLSTLELLLGICVLSGVRIRQTSWAALILTAVFTLLTLWLAIFSPIADCGCFGEAIHLTNWQTFFKNLILLPCILVVWGGRRRISPVASPAIEWTMLILFAVGCLSIGLRALRTTPFIEFTAFRTGGDLNDSFAAHEYEALYIYEKDGVQEKFTIDNLPDSTWSYVDAEISAPENVENSGFLIMDPYGEDITSQILSKEKAVIASYYDPEKISREGWDSMADFRDRVLSSGGTFYLVVSHNPEIVPQEYGFDVCTGDRKMLMTLSRTNGGAAYLSDGVVILKWAACRIGKADVEAAFAYDADIQRVEVMAHRRTVTYITFFSILLAAVLLRYICRLIAGRSRLRAPRETKGRESSDLE